MTVLLATACGVAVANLYLSQPLVGLISGALGISHDAAGSVVTLAQLGYAAGLLFLVPLGDLVENRRLIVLTLSGTVLSLALAAAAPNAPVFLAASLLIGISSVAVQMLVPFAAHLAPDAIRGRVVGNVMSGLILGILLARPVASLLADLFGWRSAFAAPAVLMAGLTLVLWRRLPRRKPEFGRHYGHLLRSMARLIVTEPPLQRRTAYQAALFACFSLFWTAIPLRLAEPPFSYGQRGMALFALCGAAGALAAPIAGRLADAGWSRAVTGVAMLTVAASFILGWVGQSSIVLLALAAILLDAGVQLNQIVGQRAIYGINPEMRSRANGIYMAIFFIGGAVGSSLASPVLARAGWSGVSLLGVALALTALVAFVLAEPRR